LLCDIYFLIFICYHLPAVQSILIHDYAYFYINFTGAGLYDLVITQRKPLFIYNKIGEIC
ncbi:hypothetical protein KU711_18865, partial [Salmonella enterica subsp. enterica serovar Give]|nr:hypothetical protein [Salmonella enterica subsp. enterica serovar Give]